jgi:hypothetical protein
VEPSQSRHLRMARAKTCLTKGSRGEGLITAAAPALVPVCIGRAWSHSDELQAAGPACLIVPAGSCS